MNKSRRKRLTAVISLMMELKKMENSVDTQNKLKAAAQLVDEVNDEEEMAYDNLPESMMWSAKADAYADNLDNLADALVDIELIAEKYEEATDNPYHLVEKEVSSVIRNCTEVIER